MKLFLNLINLDYLTQIYIGITGVLIAIVIFIAESLKGPYELKNKIILKNTNIKRNVIIIVIVFIYFIACNMFEYNKYIDIKTTHNLHYIITGSISLLLVVISAYLTGRMFCISLKLKTSKNFFNKKLEEFIHNNTLKLAKKEKKRNLIDKNKKLKLFIKEQTVYFEISSKSDINENYLPAFPLKNGTIQNYDFNRLIDLINIYDEEKYKEEEYCSINDRIVGFCQEIGSTVNRNTPVFYCLGKYKWIFENINEYIIFEENDLYNNEELQLINNDLFDMALDSIKFNSFDENERLYKYFVFLYKNKIQGCIELAMDSIEFISRKLKTTNIGNMAFCKFLNKIIYLTQSNDDFNNYKKLNYVILSLYISQINNKLETKETTYNFINDVVKVNMYLTENNNDWRFYDSLMSILLRFVAELMTNKMYEELKIIVQNIRIDRNVKNIEELESYDIINFQFSIGLIYCFLILSEKGYLNNDDFSSTKDFIMQINRELMREFDTWNIIKCFRKYFNKETCVETTYRNFEFYIVEHKYISSWVFDMISERSILQEMLYLYKIDYADISIVNLDDIKKEDKYYYLDLKRLIENQTKIEQNLIMPYDKERVLKLVDYIIKNAIEKEENFNKTNTLSEHKKNEFKELVINSLKDISFIREQIPEIIIKENDMKLKKICGINKLVQREYFFDNSCSNITLAKNYCETIKNAIIRDYFKTINTMIRDKTLQTKKEINKIKNINDYIVLSNYMDDGILDKYKYDYKDNTIIVNQVRIKVVKTSRLNGCYLINKNYLPILQLCGYSDKWSKGKIYNHIFYDFNDCSKDEQLRQQMIKESKWLIDKGSEEEQDEYLKNYCKINLLYSYRIIKPKNYGFIKLI